VIAGIVVRTRLIGVVMVTPTNDQDRLIDQALSLLRNAMAETKTVLPVVQFRPAESKAVLPSETLVQEERAASLQMLPMVANIAVSEAPSPSLEQLDTKQVSKDMVPIEPSVQEEETPPLIDQTLSMVEQSLQQLIAKQTSKDVPPTAPPVQEERTPSPINQTMSMVAVAVSEPTVTEAPPPSLQQPIAKQTSKDVVPTAPPVQEERTASLIAQALSIVKSVAAAEPKPVLAPSPFQQPVAKQTSKDVRSTKPPVRGTASLIGQTLSMVAVAVSESTVAEASSPSLQQPVNKQPPRDVLPSAPSLQDQRPASLIDHALSMVEIGALAEPGEPEGSSAIQQPVVKQASKDVLPSEPPMQEERTVSVEQPVAKQTSKDLLPTEPPVQVERTVCQTPSLIENVAVPQSKAAEAAPLSLQQPLVKQLTSKERLNMERADIQKRIAIFKANQQRFQQEREEYYATTMAKARATQ
jgi:hypothetical protein